ncbi:hypothetical protein D9M68_891170 [compost metagenome]
MSGSGFDLVEFPSSECPQYPRLWVALYCPTRFAPTCLRSSRLPRTVAITLLLHRNLTPATTGGGVAGQIGMEHTKYSQPT